MSHFLLLHGSWHGAWCWYKVLPRLVAAGSTVTAIDLPGRGRASAMPFTVGLDRMVRAAEAALSPHEKTTIVVHSRNGIVASALAEKVPTRIARVIYLAAMMLPSGRRVLDYLPDHDSWIGKHIRVDRLALRDSLDPSIYRDGLYADCADEDVALARSLLVPEPVRPALTRLRLSHARYGQVPRGYIRLSQDRAVSLSLQDRLLRETSVDRVETMQGSHSVYFSQPQRLTEIILQMAG